MSEQADHNHRAYGQYRCTKCGQWGGIEMLKCPCDTFKKPEQTDQFKQPSMYTDYPITQSGSTKTSTDDNLEKVAKELYDLWSMQYDANRHETILAECSEYMGEWDNVSVCLDGNFDFKILAQYCLDYAERYVLDREAKARQSGREEIATVAMFKLTHIGEDDMVKYLSEVQNG